MRFLYALFLNFINLCFLPLRVLRRHRAAPKSGFIALNITGSPVEMAPKRRFWERGPRPFALSTWRAINRKIADDDRVRGVCLTLKNGAFGSATTDSLRELVAETRRLGKQVVIYLPEGANTEEWLVAAGADQLLLGPETHVSALGFAVEAHYLKDALQKVGVEPEVFSRGDYKTAAEAFVRTSMSEAQREQLGALLDDRWETLVTGLSEGRAVDRATAERFIHEGPWAATEAQRQGMADGVIYPDELPARLSGTPDEEAKTIPALRYLKRRRLGFRPLLRKPHIAVVDVVGAIVSRANPMAAGRLAVEKDIVEALTAAREARRVKGVILHIDTRGGGALASDRIRREVQRLAEEKPVVAQMGDAAASGGYMVAANAHTIVAQPGTVTGSIGVVAARLMVEPLLERVGVAVEVMKRGSRADMGSATRSLDSGERAALERQIEDTYVSFLDVVAKGRNQTRADIEPLAGGRVWSGKRALENGLVDELGGFDVALTTLRGKLGPGSERYACVRLGSQRRPPSGLLGLSMLGLGQEGAELNERLGPLSNMMTMLTGAERTWLWCETNPIDLGRS